MTVNKKQLESLFLGLGIDLNNSELIKCSFVKERQVYSVCLTISPIIDNVCVIPPDNFFIKELPNGYTEITKNGKKYVYGRIQASIIKQLYEAYMKGQPWVYGKTLMKNANSSGNRLGTLFVRRIDWKELIIGNKQGLYRLNVE